MLVPYVFAECWLDETFGIRHSTNLRHCNAWVAHFCRGVSWMSKPVTTFCEAGRNITSPDWSVWWRSNKVAVEFHSQTLPLFTKQVLPASERLHALYEERGGVCVTAVLVREPASHLLASFAMWPPRNRTLLPFPLWMEAMEAEQAKQLGQHGPHLPPTLADLERNTGERCRRFLPSARRALSAIDLAGPTECLRNLLTTVIAWLALTPISRVQAVEMPIRRPTHANALDPKLIRGELDGRRHGAPPQPQRVRRRPLPGGAAAGAARADRGLRQRCRA